MREKGTVILCSLTTQAHKVVYGDSLALHETQAQHLACSWQHTVVSIRRDHAESASAVSQSRQPELPVSAACIHHHRLAELQAQQVSAAGDAGVELQSSTCAAARGAAS